MPLEDVCRTRPYDPPSGDALGSRPLDLPSGDALARWRPLDTLVEDVRSSSVFWSQSPKWSPSKRSWPTHVMCVPGNIFFNNYIFKLNNIKKGNGSWQAPNVYYIIYTIKNIYIKHVSSLEYYTFIVAPKTQQPIRRGLSNQARPVLSQSGEAFQSRLADSQS